MTAKSWFDGDVVALFNNVSGTITPEHGDVLEFDPRGGGGGFGISAVIKPGADLTHFTGPILHGIYDAGVPEGYPWGLHVSGEPPSSGYHEMGLALTYPTGLGIGKPVNAVVLVPQAMPSTFVKVATSGWTFVMAGVVNSGERYCYIGNTVGITNPTDPSGAAVAGIFDFSDYLVQVSDENYGVGSVSPNAKNTFETEDSGYTGGDADHPDVPSALQTIRDMGMTTIGCALIGAPYLNLTPTDLTQNGTPCPPFVGYFDGLTAGTGTYGTIDSAGTTGTNSAGPIHFAGYLSEVALWRRAITFTEASSLWAGRAIW